MDLSYLCEMEGEAQKLLDCHHADVELRAEKGCNNNYHIGDSLEREIRINTAVKFRDWRMYLVRSLQHHLENKSWC